MPNLQDLFNSGENFNLDEFLSQAEAAIGQPASPPPEPGQPEDPDPGDTPPTEPPLAPDPHDGLVQIGPDEWVHPSELEDLVNLHRQITAREPRQVLSGGAPAAAPPAEPREDLPDWVRSEEDPRFERMYRHFEEQNRSLREAEMARQFAQVQQSVAITGARQAAGLFAQKYGLSEEQIRPIAEKAGTSGLARAMEQANTNPDGSVNYGVAYFQALETEAFRNETFRPLVSAPRPDPTQPAPEDIARQRTLTGLSAAASPSSAPAEGRPPAETRGDGRLTEISRSSLVNELAAGLMRERQG